MSENKEELKQEDAVTASSDMEITFSKSYKFEGENIEKIDLSGLHDIKAADMIDASRYMNRIGMNEADEEFTLPYALFIASRASGRPMELFTGLAPFDALRVKGRIVSFFMGRG
ncbi:MAG: phage tail assembly protein [Lachnospiraceae bacterium]|nr:phage tail assembly protein [Lachnospiraceae bacterium]